MEKRYEKSKLSSQTYSKRPRQTKQKKYEKATFDFFWDYMGKPVKIEYRLSLDQMIEKFLQESKQKLRELEDK